MTKRILIAEDEASLREMLALHLRESGGDVETAQDGEEAISMIRRRLPGLLFLDLLMPKKDGFAVMEYILAQSLDLPVIVLTNFADPLNEDRCRELGAKEVIIKSQIDGEDLWQKALQYLR
jgi:CheY-like chemotaxis protein